MNHQSVKLHWKVPQVSSLNNIHVECTNFDWMPQLYDSDSCHTVNFTNMYMYSCISKQKEYQTFSPSFLSAKSVH